MIIFLQPDQYQKDCQALYQVFAERIAKTLNHAHIAHIGSSAIPGALSKGDLDIYVGVSAEQFNQSIQQLKQINFIEKKDTLATKELRMLESQEHDHVAIQLVVQNSAYDFFLTFRDVLRNQPELVAEYNQMKSSCRDMTMDEYRMNKSDFIQAVLSLNKNAP